MLLQGGFVIAQTETVATIHGKKITINPNALSTGDNGLTVTNGNIQLGGILTKSSVLTTTSAFTLAIQGLQAGSANDNIIVSDANGVLKSVSKSSLGDNLGSHIATQHLDMSTKNILNIQNAYVKNEVQVLDRIAANTNYFGIYKNNGLFGIWNNSKNANAITIDETTSKTTLTSAQIAKGTDGTAPSAGYVATAADNNGNVIWKAPVANNVMGIKVISSNYTVTPSDYNVIASKLNGDITITLPDPAISIGRILVINQIDITTDSGAGASVKFNLPVIYSDTVSINQIVTDYYSASTGGSLKVTLQSDGTNWYVISFM